MRNNIRSIAVVLSLAIPITARALDGNNPLNMTMMNQWLPFELLTQRDSIGPIADPGYGNTALHGLYDGIGTYRAGNKAIAGLTQLQRR